MDWFSNDVATLVVVVACLPLLKFVLNLVRYLRIKRYLSKYKKWHASRDERFLESKAQVVKLVKDAGVADQRISVSELVGYGSYQVRDASVLDNFPHLRQDMSTAAQRLMREAIGAYRARMLEALSPLYWIESVLYLPRTVLRYLDLPAEGTRAKILQVVWWIVGAVSTTALALYAVEIRTFIEGLF